MSDIKYVLTKKATEIMSLSTRRVLGLCNDGKVECAFRCSRDERVFL